MRALPLPIIKIRLSRDPCGAASFKPTTVTNDVPFLPFRLPKSQPLLLMWIHVSKSDIMPKHGARHLALQEPQHRLEHVLPSWRRQSTSKHTHEFTAGVQVRNGPAPCVRPPCRFSQNDRRNSCTTEQMRSPPFRFRKCHSEVLCGSVSSRTEAGKNLRSGRLGSSKRYDREVHVVHVLDSTISSFNIRSRQYLSTCPALLASKNLTVWMNVSAFPVALEKEYPFNFMFFPLGLDRQRSHLPTKRLLLLTCRRRRSGTPCPRHSSPKLHLDWDSLQGHKLHTTGFIFCPSLLT